jgi:hypothetical protein
LKILNHSLITKATIETNNLRKRKLNKELIKSQQKTINKFVFKKADTQEILNNNDNKRVL